MACLPLIERELRVALRKQRPAQGRLKIAALATGGSMLFLWFGALTNNRGVGRGLEQILCVAGLSFVLRAPRLTAGVLAEERRNQTLGLLFLSGLGAGEVFAGKFLSSALIAFTNLLAIFPMLALPFLIGGVSYDLFLAIISELPVLMFFALAVSLLASVLTEEDGAALVLANVLGGLLCALPPVIYLAQSHFSGLRLSAWWLCLSPAYGPYLVWRGFGSGFHPGEKAEFWRTLSVTLGWSALALGAAMFALTRVWREKEERSKSSGWRRSWRQFVHGDSASRQRLGRSWLDENPFVWLAARDRQPATLGWLVVCGIVLIWLICWAVWRSTWTTALNFFFTAALFNLVLTWLSRHTAAQKIGQARRDGSYELLLTTPLEPSDIVWGELDALRWQFGPLSNFILGLNTLMMLGGLMARAWNTGALVVYLCIWCFLLAWSWDLRQRWSRVLLVMWVSLNCGRPAHAVWRTYGSNANSGFKWYYWIWVWNIFNSSFWSKGFQNFPSGSLLELVLTLSFTGLFLLMYIIRSFFTDAGNVHDYKWDAQAKDWLPMRRTVDFKGAEWEKVLGRRLISEFREIVREPLPDPSDPRFKKWNALERFPWGWEITQHQLLERLGRRSVEAEALWKSGDR